VPASAAATVHGRTVVPVRRCIDERTFHVATAKRTTMNKMNRERELKEKRALKQERKDQKKLAAAAAAEVEAGTPLTDPSAGSSETLPEH
jgi:hypothetical protein